MCRLAAYSGPPRSLHSLWFASSHDLEAQSHSPREMKTAILNADGFGMTWYSEHLQEPALYRTVLPLWADENVRRMAKHVVTSCALSNVRSATTGMPTQLSNVSPFVEGRWSFTHNGFIRDFGGSLARTIRDGLDDARYGAILGNTDSEHLFAFVMTRIAALEPGTDPTAVVRSAIHEIVALVEGKKALLNLIVTDGEWIVAVRHAVAGDAPTLYRRQREGGVEIVSEPLDGEGWQEVAPGSIVTVTPGRQVRCETL